MTKSKNKYLLEIIGFLAISLLYFATRLQNLITLPVFADEAIYIRWSQVMKSVETLRFLPLTDGKQPFFMWLTIPFLKFFSDPLMAGRLLSVLAGFGTLTGLYAVSRIFFSKHLSPFLPAILYLLLPFTFFFDRLALADNLLSMFGVWILFLSLLLAKYPRFDLAMVMGGIIGFAWLTKSPAIFFICLSFLPILFTSPKKIYLPLISAAIAFGIYNVLRLGPQFHMIALRNRDYVWPVSEILKHPLDPFRPHFLDILSLYSAYISWPLMIISIFGLIIYFKKLSTNHYLLTTALWWLLPLLANAAFAKVFTARYILYTVPPLILLLSLGLYQIHKINKFLLLVPLVLFLSKLSFVYHLSIDPFDARLPSTEAGYIVDWTSGWGIKEAANFLIERSKVANVIVGTEGSFGTLPDGLQIYTNQIPRLTVVGVGVPLSQIPANLLDARDHGDEVYLIVNQNRHPLPYQNLNVIHDFIKPDNSRLLLIKI